MRDTINFLLHVKMGRLSENVKIKVMPLDSESKNKTNLLLSNLHWSTFFSKCSSSNQPNVHFSTFAVKKLRRCWDAGNSKFQHFSRFNIFFSKHQIFEANDFGKLRKYKYFFKKLTKDSTSGILFIVSISWTFSFLSKSNAQSLQILTTVYCM